MNNRQRSVWTLLTLILVAVFCGCRPEASEPPQPVLPVPSAAQLAWHRMELNAFVHFTINTFTDKEWGYGDESPALFNPTDIDIEQWITTLKETGFKGVILTTKHHDGFCLWPSTYTEHSITNSPYKEGKGDIVREVANACRKHGLKFGIYVSPWDRNRADYGRPAYIEYYRNQLKELFTMYGPIFEMWFDGANGGDGYYGGANERRRIDGATYYDWPTTLEMVRDLEPEVIFFSDAGPGVRWVGNERGVASETNWNTITPDTLYAGKAGIEELLGTGHEEGTHWIPAEVDVSIRPGWFYHAREDSLVKSPEDLFRIYMTSVGRGSTLLLNVPPDKRGRFHEKDVQSLRGLRKIIDREFAINLASGANAVANTTRANHSAFAATHVTDDDPETYWTTDDDVTTGTITISLNNASDIRYIQLQEYIKLGQRVKQFNVEIRRDGEWVRVAEATTIGYKRILELAPVRSAHVRINITASRACPLISSIAVF